MRKLIDAISCLNIFPILLIENTKEAQLGASLKIFPIVTRQEAGYDEQNVWQHGGHGLKNTGHEEERISFSK
jgi:hypothetical protein